MQAKAFPSSKLNSGSGLFDDSYSILLSLSGNAAALPRLTPAVVARRAGGPYVAPGHLRALVVDALAPSEAFLDLDPFAYVLDANAGAAVLEAALAWAGVPHMNEPFAHGGLEPRSDCDLWGDRLQRSSPWSSPLTGNYCEKGSSLILYYSLSSRDTWPLPNRA